MNSIDRKKEWVHLIVATLVVALVWICKDIVAIVLCTTLTFALVLWAVAMWQALEKGIPVKAVTLEETFKDWCEKLKVRFTEIKGKSSKTVEAEVIEYETDDKEDAENLSESEKRLEESADDSGNEE